MSIRRNLITDVPGLRVGNAHDSKLASGRHGRALRRACGCLLRRHGRCAGDARDGSSRTRQDGSGHPRGRACRADRPSASMRRAVCRPVCGEQGIGFAVGSALVPLVSQAAIFDLLNGGDKEWGLYPPYRELGFEAAGKAGPDFELGTAGGGFGATTVNLKGGLGSASTMTSTGHTIGALVVVNSISSAIIGKGPHFWAAAFEEGEEFGGLGHPDRVTSEMRELAWKGGRAALHHHRARGHRRAAHESAGQAARGLVSRWIRHAPCASPMRSMTATRCSPHRPADARFRTMRISPRSPPLRPIASHAPSRAGSMRPRRFPIRTRCRRGGIDLGRGEEE